MKMDVDVFVNMLKHITLNVKTLYVMGCFGAPMTPKNKTRYKNNHIYNRDPERQAMIDACDENTFGFDCVNLIKGILWGWVADEDKTYGGATYTSNGVPDIGANQMFAVCENVSNDFSNIEIGEAVWLEGHIGVYVGNGEVVECTPKWKNCVQITKLNQRKWIGHGKLPYVNYNINNIKLTKEQQWCVDNGYIKGYGNDNYGWDDNLTRGQLAIVLYRIFNKE